MTEQNPEPLGAIIRHVKWYIQGWETHGLAFAVLVCGGILLNAGYYLSKTGDSVFNFYLFITLFLTLTLCHGAARLLKIKWDANEIAEEYTRDTIRIVLIGSLYLIEYGVFPLCFIYIIMVDTEISLFRLTQWPPDLAVLISNIALIASVLSPFVLGGREEAKK